MTSARPTLGAGRAPADFRHETTACHGDEGFLAEVVPFVRAGLAAGEPVLVTLPPARAELLGSALGGDAGAVRFLDAAAVGSNPARVIPAWREVVDTQAGAPLRAVSEPVHAGQDAAA
ncbi:MAG TPA: MEDS domain-containing protein, partial [Pseudonocardiaceae bacterium]